jgi:hypothetical protein
MLKLYRHPCRMSIKKSKNYFGLLMPTKWLTGVHLVELLSGSVVDSVY